MFASNSTGFSCSFLHSMPSSTPREESATQSASNKTSFFRLCVLFLLLSCTVLRLLFFFADPLDAAAAAVDNAVASAAAAAHFGLDFAVFTSGNDRARRNNPSARAWRKVSSSCSSASSSKRASSVSTASPCGFAPCHPVSVSKPFTLSVSHRPLSRNPSHPISSSARLLPALHSHLPAATATPAADGPGPACCCGAQSESCTNCPRTSSQ